jgi:hypothetical protein
VADSIIFRHLDDKAAAQVLSALTKSYYLSGDYAMTYVSSIRFLAFYSDSKQAGMVHNFLNLSYNKLKNAPFSPQQILNELKKLREFSQKLDFIIKAAILTNSKSTHNYALRQIYLLRQYGYDVPFWAEQWEYLYQTGLCNRCILKSLNFSLVSDLRSVDMYEQDVKGFCRFLLKLSHFTH